MRHIIPFSFLYLSSFSIDCIAKSPVTDATGTICYKVEVPPEFPGDETALAKFLSKYIHSPRSARENGASGIVFIQFEINENGKIINPVSKSPDMDTSIVLPKDPPAKDSAHNTIYYSNPAYKPEFPGGSNGLVKYLKKNFQYPQEALESGIEGTVTVQFTINGDGTISHVSTISPKLGGHLELEAIRLVRSMPNWKPALENGKGIPAQCNIPVEFSLREYYTNKKKKIYPMF